MISLIAAELVPMGILKDLLAVKNLDVVPFSSWVFI